MEVQADLGLRCWHMPKDMFLHGVAQIVLLNLLLQILTWPSAGCGTGTLFSTFKTSGPPNCATLTARITSPGRTALILNNNTGYDKSTVQEQRPF